MKLFINEFIKDYRKISTYIYLGLILLLLVGANWLRTLNLETSTQILSSEEMAIFTNSTFGVLTSIVTVFILIMLANNISQEYTKGTIKFLYSKPKSRSAILTAKIVLAIFNFVLFLGISFAADLLMKKYIFFTKSVNFATIFNQVLDAEHFNNTLGQHLMLEFLTALLMVVFYITLVVLICLVFRSQVLSVIVVLLMLLASDLVNLLVGLGIEKYPFLKYSFTYVPNLPHYFTSESMQKVIEEGIKLTSTDILLMTFVYTCIFGLISYLVNAYRDINLD